MLKYHRIIKAARMPLTGLNRNYHGEPKMSYADQVTPKYVPQAIDNGTRYKKEKSTSGVGRQTRPYSEKILCCEDSTICLRISSF